MSKFKVIDAEAIDNDIARVQGYIQEIEDRQEKNKEDESTLLVLKTSVGVMYGIKMQLRSLEAHLGIQPSKDVHPGDGLLNVTEFDRKYLDVVDTGAEDYKIPETEKQKNSCLLALNGGFVDFAITKLTNQLAEFTTRDIAAFDIDGRLNFNICWAQLNILMEIKKATESLMPHLQNAFKAGVSSTYLDGYHTAMYQYLQKRGYKSAA